MVEEYLASHHKTDILGILQDPDDKKHYCLNINFVELFEYDTNLGNNILKNPDEALEELNELILEVQNTVIEQSNDAVACIPKIYIHARVYGLPACPELHRNIFPKNEDLNLFLQITGTVVRITATKMLEYQRPYICTKCKHIAMVEAVYDQKYIIIPPKKCSNSNECNGKNLISAGDLDADNCKDYQEIKIQEQSSKLGVGSMPSSMWVTLEDDLVDACKPGDDITLCGIVKRRWGALVPGKKIEVELVLKANHIQVNNGQSSPSLITPEIKGYFLSFWEKYKNRPLEGRDLILKSFCPKLYGMYTVKLAMAVVLAGGSHCKQGNEVGIQIRSEPHILLVGDPGTGKSQLLRYAAKVIPRSVLTTGVGTTSAGLTVAAIMEDGQWQLEGGALVLADGGICCIDEFNSMKPHDRASIHEAMEQQTISVAKASMVCKLSTRCSILAATNPKGGHLDSSQPLSLNLALPSPLLSRFDVVLMLKDTCNADWDNLVADYILSGKGLNAVKINSALWSLEMLQQYFTVIRGLNPVLTPSTNKILSCYYQAQRRATSRNLARTTVRLLDSLVRLSQAHARLMYHTEVQIMDALFAVFLIENSMHGECAVFSLNQVNVQAPFEAKPMESYARLAISVLDKLGLRDILKDEITALSNGYENTNSSGSDTSLENSTETTIKSNEFVANITLGTEIVVERVQEDDTEIKNTDKVASKSSNINEEDEHKISDEGDSIKLQIKSKFFIEKSASTTEDEQKIKNESSLINSNSRTPAKGKKRKNVKPREQSEQSKSARKNGALSDFQMLKLIPSANDDFDMEVLNFMNEDNNDEEPSFAIDNNSKSLEFVDESIISQMTKLRQEVRENFSFKPKIQPRLKPHKDKGNNSPTNKDFHNDDSHKTIEIAKTIESASTHEQTIQNSLQNVENPNKTSAFKNGNEIFIEKSKSNNNETNSVSNHCTDISDAKQVKKVEQNKFELLQEKVPKLSQNTKSKQFRAKFSFKPVNRSDTKENEPTSGVNESGTVNQKKNNLCNNVSKLAVQASQNLFESQDQDYDSLDF